MSAAPTKPLSSRRSSDPIESQFDYVADQMTAMETRMIDPQEFGRLQAEVAGQRRDLDRMAISLDAMAKSMDAIQSQLAEARGGWKILLLVGGASATIGAVIAKVAVWWSKAGAPGP